jgi:O-antigen biosynthesis protein
MISQQPRRALIATHHLVQYAGTEVFTLELAELLRQRGWEVCISAFLIGYPMAAEFESRGHQLVPLLQDIGTLKHQHFDLLWIQHGPVLHHLLATHGILAKRIIYCSHSHFEPLEAVPSGLPPGIEILAHSEENRAAIARQMEIPSERIGLFRNATSASSWIRPATRPTKLARIALVSNHPPPELLEATQSLRVGRFHVEHFGLGGQETLVTADVLQSFDAIITIGKTVVACAFLNKPIYCYDHFGGPGWLSSSTLDTVAFHNFSGRGFGPKTAQEIATEIRTGFEQALRSIDSMHKYAQQHLNLNCNLDRLLASAPPASITAPWAPSRNEVVLQKVYLRLLQTQEATSMGSLKEIARIKSTWSWQLTKPLRLLHTVWNLCTPFGRAK